MSDRHILVVDDDPQTLMLVRMVLEEQGYRVTVTEHGEQALEIAGREVLDLIILDVMMPDLDGYAVARRLNENPATSAVPIIMFSARGQLDDRAAGYEAGVDDYIIKPAHPAELLARVQAVLAQEPALDQETPPAQEAWVLACVGAQAGAGTTTVAINCMAALAAAGDDSIVLAEFPQRGGTLAARLNVEAGLAALLDHPDDALEADALVSYGEDVWVLAAPDHPLPDSVLTPYAAAHAVRMLASRVDAIVLDLDAEINDLTLSLVGLASDVLVVTAPTRQSLADAHHVCQGLRHAGIAPQRISTALVYQHAQEQALNVSAIAEGLGVAQVMVIPAAPDLMQQAAQRNVPPVGLAPESDFSRPFHEFVNHQRGYNALSY